MPIVVVGHQRKFGRWGVGDNRTRRVSPILVVVVLLRAAKISLDNAELGVRRPSRAEADGLAGVVVDAVVPAVDHIAGHGKFAVEGVLSVRAKVEVRNSPGEKQAS